MEIRISTRQILNVLLVVAWIIFIGLCIEAGCFIFNTIYLWVKPEAITKLWLLEDLSDLMKYDHGHFLVVTGLLGIGAVLKAWMFYVTVKLLHNKQLDLARPFSNLVRRFILTVSCITLMIGVMTGYCVKYVEWLAQKGVSMPETLYLRLGGADVWLFMAVILFIIAQIFKKGIEIQTESDLTI